ncbi:MFS transporter [Falsiroseomonas sp. CW058]|uniref:MFS transporter n=1 Tax=Falsiroseomonas sp. CW058 TaxID=3388664 RepID=UPI003D319FF3
MADPPGGAALLKRAPFLLFLSSRILSQGALQVQAVAVGWQLYELTGSALDLGLLGLVQFLPVLLMTLPAGHVADRHPRKLVVGSCRMAAGVAVLALGLGSLAGWLDRTAIFVLVGLLGIARAFEMPAQQALLPGVVPGALFPRAVSLTTTAGQLATICGPAVAGALIVLGGTAAAYLPAAVALLAAGAMALAIAVPPHVPAAGGAGLARFFEGVAFLRARPVLVGAVSLDMVAVAMGGAAALFPVYARDVLAAGPVGLGMLRAAPAVGAMATGLFLAWRPLRGRSGLRMFQAVILFGVATTGFALSTSLILSVALLVVVGAADVVSVVVRQSIVQLGTPDEMRGRVAAVNSLFIGASNQLGEFRAGGMAAAIGPMAAAAIGGACTVAVALAWMRIFPALRGIDRLEEVAEGAPKPM